MAYTAEIQVAVKGAKQLQDLASAIQKTSTEIDRLNRDIKTLSEGGLPRTINNLSSVVREAADAFNEVALGTREAADAARAYVNATNALNTGLEERSALLDKISRQERAAAMVRTGITMPTQQLMLPSSEMLQAGKRGLQQLSSYYGDINVEIDSGVQSGRAFTEQLAQSASAAETLPPIFNQVQQALQATAKATADGGAVQTSWLKVLSEFPRIQADILKNQIAEIKLNKESLNVDYARLEARKRMQRIREFEAGQQTKTQRTQQLNESLALGVGFPLLFGGGVGTVAGSFAGSFAGKGFGGQIIGGALGQVAENTIRSIAQITSSLETIVAAAGIAGTATEKYIETLKKAGKEEEALAVATAALANVIGQDGVKALKDFEAAGTTLSNSLTQLATQLAAKAAQALGGPAGGIAGALEESALFGQAQQSTDAQQIANFTKLARVYGQEYYDTLDAIYQRQRAINTEVEKNLTDNKEIVTARQVDLNALGAELELAKTNGNILNDNVYRLKEKVIEQRTYVALQDALEKGLETETVLLREQIELQQLRREREEAATRAAEQSRQKIAEAFKAQNQALRELYTAQKTYNDFVVQQTQLRDGPITAIEKQLSLLETMQVKDLQILSIERQQALNEAEKTNTVSVVNALYDQRLKNLNAQYAVQKDQLTLDYNRAKLTKQLAAQTRRESVQSAVDPIRQQQFRTEIGIEKFTTPQNAVDAQNLALEQRLRLYNTELPILNEINRINTEIQSGALSAEALEAKNLDLATQQQKLTAIKEELILLDELEQKQLKLQQFFNTYGQLIQSVSGEIANAVTFGISEMVRGTKTAEQVFADFLQAVGNALIQQAQQMIATYIAIGIARIFAGIGGSSGGSTTPFAGGAATGGTTNTFAYGAGAPTFFAGRADGGSVRASTPYLVGERGPELFVPGTNGGVMSNSDLRSSMGAAPGSAGGSPVLNMSFETSTINGVEYVSRDQLEAAMAQTRRQAARDGASRGMSMTLDKLQQSPSTRKRVGF